MKKFWLVVSTVLCMVLCLTSVAIFAANGDIQITVKIMNGKQIDLIVQPDDTISKVKTLIQEKEGILPDQQRLTFNNQELDENKTLAEYNIKNKSVLELTAPVKSVSTEEELKAALAGSTMCYVKLAADITVTNTMNIRKGSSVILDLNGCVFDLGGNKIYVNDRNLPTRLTIIDSRPDAEHKFTPEDGLWVLDETDGTKTVNGGVITGGHSDSSDNAGCIDVGLNGTVIMEAGNIVGCYADGHGGAVHVGGTDGTFIMNGGSIAGCKAGSMGGGVSVDSRSGSFTMNGGSITDCVTGTNSSDSGGGVSVERGTFTLAGGTIQNCTAGDGAGVYVSADTTFTMTGGIIQHCVADNNGGALYINGGTMNAGSGTVDGTVMVNTYYDYNSNSDIPGVIQGIAGSFEDTLFKQDVFNAGEIRFGTFLGKVTVGDNTSKGVIRDGVFNNVVIVNCGSVFNGTFNGDVVINDVPSVEPPLLSGGNYNRLIKNNSTSARFEGAHSPFGIVGTKPSTTFYLYYKVTFDPNGGDMEYPERYFCNKGIISDYIEPTKEGCIFGGWYKADGKKWNCASDVVTEDVTLTAMWKHIHCICGGSTTVGDHTKHTDIDWIPWISTDSLPDKEGNYYLVNDVTLTHDFSNSYYWKVKEKINICLNGKTISTNSTFARVESESLSVTDCGTGGKIIGGDIYYYTPTSINISASVYVSYGSVFNLYGGTLLMREDGKHPDNSIIYTTDNAIFNMYGGTIGDSADINTETDGYSLKIDRNNVFNAYGGTIYGPAYFIAGSRINFVDTAFASHVRLKKGQESLYTGAPKLIGNARLAWQYPVYIFNGDEEIRVDDINKNDIYGDGGSVKCEIDEVKNKATLTLTNANIAHGTRFGSLISCSGYQFEIVLVGKNVISSTNETSKVINTSKSLTISGSGNLDINCNNTSVILASEVTLKGTGNININNPYHAYISAYGLTLESGKLSINTNGFTIRDPGYSPSNLNIKGGTFLFSNSDEIGTSIMGNLGMGADMMLMTGASADGKNTVLTDITDKTAIENARYIYVSAAHTHCICGGAAYDGHTKHTDATWMPWTSTGSLPTAAGNYYLVGNVTLPEGRISLPDGVNLCLNGNKINYGKKYAVYTEISVADNGTFSVTDCGTTGGFGNFDIFDSKLVMYGGKIIKDSALRINGGASFLMTGNAQNDGVIVIKGYSGFIMRGNAKNDGFISLLGIDDIGTVEFCGRADGGSVFINQPQDNAKIHLYDNAKITGLYATTSCIIRLIMRDNAEIGEVKNIDFSCPQLSGNAKLGTADSSFSIRTYEKSDSIIIKDNVQLFGTVTVQLDDDATFTLGGKASITGELIVKKSGKTGNRATVVMAGESAVHGKLTCRDDAITFEMQGGVLIDGDIDLGGAQVNGKVICTGDIIDGIFNGDVENNGRIIGGIFYGKVTGNGTIEDSAKVDVIFNTNGGDAVVKQRILRGQKAQKTTAISKAGYIFDSWQLGGAIFDFATTPITEDTTITAVWIQCDHSGSTAHPTCTASATCTICAGTIAAIGHSPETGYKHDETSHWIACRNCNEELNKASHAGTDDGDCTTAVLCEECKYIITAARFSHTWDAWTSNGNNTHTHRCTVKGCTAGTETENCSGGTATCIKTANCDYCKQKYGNINSGNHVNLIKVPAIASTAISKGNIEYFVCDDCKKLFADEKGTKEITLADTVTEKAAPTIIFGADSKWYRYGANEYLEFRSDALYADFISVSVDGKLLDESQYEKSEGSIIIRIKADYLNSILMGKHTVTITSVSGDANANFVVTFPDADVPTGDSFIIWLASFAAGLSGLIASAVVFVKRRSKHKEN